MVGVVGGSCDRRRRERENDISLSVLPRAVEWRESCMRYTTLRICDIIPFCFIFHFYAGLMVGQRGSRVPGIYESIFLLNRIENRVCCTITMSSYI